MTQGFLSKLGVPERCISEERSAEENRRSIHLRLDRTFAVKKVHVDGCWIGGEQRKVDFLFYIAKASNEDSDRVALLAELKGGDLGHALTQLEETLRFLEQQHAWRSAQRLRKFGYIILSHGRQVPYRQQALQRLTKRYQILIRHPSRQVTLSDGDLGLAPRQPTK